MAEIAIPYELETPRGTLEFNPTPIPGDNYLRLSAVEGLSGGVVRSTVEPVPQRDGATVFDAFRGAMYPILRGQVKAADLTDRRERIEELEALTDSILRADGILRWTPTGAAERRLTVRLLEAVQISAGPGVIKEFQLALVAGDPTVYAELEQTADSAALTVGGGGAEVFPHGFPYSYGDFSGGGNVNVTNGGTVPTFPIVEVYGPITGPAVYNVTTGKVVSFPGLSIGAGDYLEVDMRRETAELNGSPDVNMIRYLDVAGSEFFALEPGVNAIRLSGTGFDAATIARVKWRDAYL